MTTENRHLVSKEDCDPTRSSSRAEPVSKCTITASRSATGNRHPGGKGNSGPTGASSRAEPVPKCTRIANCSATGNSRLSGEADGDPAVGATNQAISCPKPNRTNTNPV